MRDSTFVNKKELPEISYTADSVYIEDEERKYFIEDEDISDNFFSLEKSMNQVVSEEILNNFSSVTEFNSLIGKATDRYRTNYKNLNFLRRLFFEKNSGSLDYEKFSDYYKWIDTSISYMVNQLFPISANHTNGVMEVVESHILERNKYQNKFPLLKTHTATESPIKGARELSYNWKHGHAPLSNLDNENCLWQKERKERSDIEERETIRKIIINDNNATSSAVAKTDNTIYQLGSYHSRRLAKPYNVVQNIHKTIHGGINYPLDKDREYIHNAVHRHGRKTSIGIPVNVLIVGESTGKGVIEQQKCDDVISPNFKERLNVKVVVGKYAGDGIDPDPASDSEVYNYRTDISKLPITILSESLSTGYQSVVSEKYGDQYLITNIHSDTTYFTNEVPLQGPFTERWVGGHQSRHIDINKYDSTLRDDDTGGSTPNNLQNQYTRPEAWRLIFNERDPYDPSTIKDGVLGFTGFDYGGPYPDPTRKGATLYRGERAKRPLNLENIKTSTGSISHGNYYENYELMSVVSRNANNLYFRKNPDQANYLPSSVISSSMKTATHVMGLYGQAPFVSGNVFGAHANNRQPDLTELIAVQGQYATASFNLFQSTKGDKASGSFVIFGKDFVNSTVGSGNNDFVIVRNDSATFRFAFGGADDPADTGVATGSSDSEFWSNLKTAIQSNAGYDVDLGEALPTQYSTGSILFTKPGGGSSPRDFMQGSFDGAYFDEAPFSFSARIYVSGAMGSPGVLFSETSNAGHGYKRQIRYQPSGKLLIYRAFHVSASTNAYKQWHVELSSAAGGYDYTNQWMHLVITHDVGTGANLGFGVNDVKFYFNNNAMSLGTTTSGASTSAPGQTWNASNRGFFFFNGDSNDEDEFLGGIDEAAMWTTVLNTNTVLELYNNGEYYPPTGSASSIHAKLVSGSLIAWYRMGDLHSDTLTHGDKILDQSTGSHDLTVSEFEAGAFDHFHFVPTSVVITKSQQTFNITASTFSAIYNATMSAEGSSNAHFPGSNDKISGGTLTGSVNGDTYSIHHPLLATSTFQIYSGSAYTGSHIGVQSTGSNLQFWTRMRTAIQDNTNFNVNISQSPTSALFSLTSSTYGFRHTGSSSKTGVSFSNLLGPSGGVDHDSRYANDIVIQTTDGLLNNNKNRTVITSRFSAPGGPEVQSSGYLDVYSQEYSVYNALPYRNLTVRGSGSGESGTIRQNTHNNGRLGLRTLLSRHSGKVGSDPEGGNIMHRDITTTVASYHKIQRNIARKPMTTTDKIAPIFNEDHNNEFFQSAIPQSDFQYSWVTSSIGENYSVHSGKQRIYGHAPKDGELIDGARTSDVAVFNGIDTFVNVGLTNITWRPLIGDTSSTKKLTFTAWIRPLVHTFNNDQEDTPIIDVDGKLRFVVTPNGRLDFQDGRRVVGPCLWKSVPGSIRRGVWHHVAITHDFDDAANNPILYINGVAVTTIKSGAYSGPLQGLGSGTFLIGKNTGNGRFNGQMSNIGIWSTVLSANTISRIYNAGQTSTEALAHSTNLEAYYQFSRSRFRTIGDSASLIQDRSGNGLDSERVNSLSLLSNETVLAPVEAIVFPSASEIFGV
jgi:hypothetical protein